MNRLLASLFLLLAGALNAQNPDMEQLIRYRDGLGSLLKEPAEHLIAWEQAIREQNFSKIRATYDAFSRSSSQAYKAIEAMSPMDGDPGYYEACKEYALHMYMGSEGKIDYITRVALDNQRTQSEVQRMDKDWYTYKHYETKADKEMELAELDLFARFLAGQSAAVLCNAVQSVLREAAGGFAKYRGAPTESPFDGVAAYDATWLMPGAIKGIVFSGADNHRFVVFTFLESEDRDKALQFFNAFSVDFVSCAFPGWRRGVYRPEFGNTNPPDLKWVSYESPNRDVQVRTVMGKPRGKNFYRVQLRFDAPSQYED